MKLYIDSEMQKLNSKLRDATRSQSADTITLVLSGYEGKCYELSLALFLAACLYEGEESYCRQRCFVKICVYINVKDQ